MARRWQFVLYILLSVVDFAATVFLINHGYADEANPLIRDFAGHFASFTTGLAIYKVALVVMLLVLLRIVHKHNPDASRRLLVFANVLMLCLGAWHVVCLRLTLGAHVG